jgi:hypothetical protein
MPAKISGSLIALMGGFLIAEMPASAVAGPASSNTPAPIHGRSPSTKISNGSSTSTNWSGYAVTGETFTDVVGSWVQPTATCPSKQQEDSAFWVGIDGFSSSDDAVEQIGTDSDCNKGKGKIKEAPHYYAWWEIDTATSTSSTTIPETVSAGDHMTAEVSNADGTYTLTLTDSGNWTYSPPPQTPSPTPAASSAEWIAEAPSVCKKKCVPVKLADFGSVTFSGATANGTSISSFKSSQINKITMVKGKTVKAAPTSLVGTGFTINWAHT